MGKRTVRGLGGPQLGCAVPTAVVGVCLEIEILDVLGIVQRVGVCPGERVNAGKWPSGLAHVGRYDGDG